MEHSENIIKPNKSLINSLLKVFAMFQLRIFFDKRYENGNVVESIDINVEILLKTLVYIQRVQQLNK